MSKLNKMLKELCPDGVKYECLGELGSFYGGITGKSKDDFRDGNAVFISYKNVYSNLAIDIDTEDRVRIAEGEKQRTLEYGDVIFTGSSETPDECGISSVVTKKTEKKLYLNSFCFVFRFNNLSIIEPEFAKHLFRSEELRHQIGKTASGVTRFNVSKKLMEKVIIPLPPIEVQREIARVLDSYMLLTSKLITELNNEIAARKIQYEYYIKKVLDFDDNTNQLLLRDVVDFRNGKGHEKDIVAEGKYVVVNSKFISTNGQVKKYTNKQICPLYVDDILMVMSDLPNGRALARCYLVEQNDKYSLNQRIGAFHVKTQSVRTKFLLHILNRNWQLLRYDNGIDQTNLKKDEILDISIPIPALEVQDRIVRFLDDYESAYNDLIFNISEEIEARQKQYGYYRDSLMDFRMEEKNETGIKG